MIPWKEQLDDVVDEASIHRIWRGIEDRRSPRAMARFRWPLIAGLAVAAGALLAIVSSDTPALPGPLTEHSGAALSETLDSVVRLDDGSRIDPTGGATFRILENTGTALTGLVSDGDTRFEVTPGGPRRWTIECGIAQVEVVGTVFTIARHRDSVEVEVERGTVIVRSIHLPEGVQRLNAHDSLVVRREVETSEPPVETHAADEPAPQAVQQSASPGSVPTFANRLEEADRARADGDPIRAERILLDALAQQTRHRDRAVAWFTVGRIRLQLRRNDHALEAIERALDEGLPAALREEATIRRIEVLVRLGDMQRAASAGAEHAAHYSRSSRRAEVDRLLRTD